MKRSLFAAVAAVMLLPGAAAAQGAQGTFYGELRGGAVFLNDADIDDESGTLAAAGIDAEIESDAGWLVEGALGYAHDSGLRGELAVGYRENQFDELTVEFAGLSASADLDGDVSAVTTMANLYYDFDPALWGGMGGLVPFVGGGVGAAFMTAEFDEIAGISIDEEEDDTVFAWKVIAGLAYNFTPTMAATVSYAYFATSDPDFDGLESEYGSHNVIGGLRFSF